MKTLHKKGLDSREFHRSVSGPANVVMNIGGDIDGIT